MKKHIKKLIVDLGTFRQEADSIIAAYQQERQQRDELLENRGGRYSETYLEEFRKSWQPSHDYKAVLDDLRKQHKEIVDKDLETIRSRIDKTLGANPNPAFASKITAYYQMGMANNLTYDEFQMLRRQASTFSELQMLRRLAESRTKSVQTAKLDDRGNPRRMTETKDDPYFIKIPSVDNIYAGFKRLENVVHLVIMGYAGTEPEMDMFRDRKSATEISFATKANTYFERGFSDGEVSFVDEIEVLDNMAEPEKRVLTSQERELLGFLTDFEKYPSLAQDRAVEIAKRDEGLKELFAADSRFCGTIQKAFAEEA
ncbi:MAG: hypothetical protein IJ716_09370 [Lachnospiraceae bacterium]|nr:hypothetical protein [Lachnospiraceae bacterium]